MACAATLLLAGAVGQITQTHAGDASLRRADQLTVVDINCPEEDSCALDYVRLADGHAVWTVRIDPLH